MAMTDPDFPNPATPAPTDAVDLSVIFTPLIRAWLYLIDVVLVKPIWATIEIRENPPWGVTLAFAVWTALVGLMALVNTVPIVRAQRVTR